MRCGRRLLCAGLTALVAAVSGCGAGSDTPALSGPPAVGTAPPALPAGGPAISLSTVGSVEVPVLSSGSGAAPIDASVKAIAHQLQVAGRTCPLTTTRSDPVVVSFRWDCTDHTVETATFSVGSGQRLALASVLSGAWPQYLSATARTQLVAGGATAAEAAAAAPADAAAYARWDLTPSALQVTVTLPSGPATLSFPLDTLTPYLPPGSPAAPRA